MHPEISENLLAELGIRLDQIGEADSWSGTETAQGGVREVALSLLVGMLPNAAVAAVPSLIAAQRGLEFCEAEPMPGQRLLGVATSQGGAPEVRSAGATEFMQAANMAWLRLGCEGGYWVQGVAGQPVIVIPKFRRIVEVLPDFNSVSTSANTQGWLSAEAEPWLRQSFDDQLARGDGFGLAAAAGIALRHDVSASTVAALHALLAGEDPPLDPMHAWFAALGAVEVAAISQRAEAETLGLRDQLHWLDRSLDLDNPHWRSTFAECCWQREALNGVAALLDWRGSGQLLADLLTAIDDEAVAWIGALHRRPPMVDPRVVAVAGVDPAAWWGQWASSQDGAHV